MKCSFHVGQELRVLAQDRVVTLVEPASSGMSKFFITLDKEVLWGDLALTEALDREDVE